MTALATLLGFDVSRETTSRLEAYAALISRWTRAINLVSPSTVGDIWRRHIIDSAQLFPLIPKEANHLVDLGSGAGLPGLVLAILAQDHLPELKVTLVESDGRKATFMRTALRETQTAAQVLTARIESLPPLRADVVTSRALAPLNRLVPLATPHLVPGGRMIFLKGANWQSEWDQLDPPMAIQPIPSRTSAESMILILQPRPEALT
ncbi:16S rRNA (guanine(527)-N(7))-methyltransferase RsmG [Paracoccus sp. p3-h83]|uniref:16S rRNA (guanine(527)-N(7))-methyltransferase RsmG n=1 Tax=Paracoccus sp. p3-h83 TaxID=3342805 RepID=UPI0035B775C5